MSDDTGSQVPTDEPKVDDTIITADASKDDGAPGGPQPLYKETGDDGKPVAEPEKKEESPAEDESKDGDDSEKDEIEAKPTDAKKKDFDLKSLERSEDSLLSDADMERILSKAKEEGLGKEAAQKQVDLADEVLKINAENVNERHSELSEQWVQECKDDKEIGGEKFDESIGNANRALKKFGTEKFMQSLNETKFGNNPEVVRVFSRIGRAMSNDDMILPGHDGKQERSLEDVFYGESKPN